MAYEFNGTNQYLNTASTPVTGVPLTIAAWFDSDSITASQAVLVVNNSTTASQGYRLFAVGNEAGDPVRANVLAANFTNISADSSLGYSANVWNHSAGVFTSTNVSVYLNGTGNTVAATYGAFPSVDRINIGTRINLGTPGAFLDGRIAEVGIWNIALTAAEIASLAKGMTCDKIRPQSLVFYAPLVRNLQDVKGGRAITNNNGATVANHPRVYA